ncbi:unnamed protein product [Hydatigera taeniaeformis]|uniref:Uncharacterized protein n=1 Tax=Hydatigena taeniaeformis TaxID=6205 RepID=A0A3P7HMV0_HYDTA|nr:unnamed protein product [Hydatigera taeniaeformis]
MNEVFGSSDGLRASGQRLKRADRESKFSVSGSANIGFPSGYSGLEWDFVPDNAPICRKPITTGQYFALDPAKSSRGDMGLSEHSASTEEITAISVEKVEDKLTKLGIGHDR